MPETDALVVRVNASPVLNVKIQGFLFRGEHLFRKMKFPDNSRFFRTISRKFQIKIR